MCSSDAYQERKEQSHLFIHQSTFATERAKLVGADNEETDLADRGEGFPVDHYDREVMEIVQDYVQALAERNEKKAG